MSDYCSVRPINYYYSINRLCVETIIFYSKGMVSDLIVCEFEHVTIKLLSWYRFVSNPPPNTVFQ